MVKQWLKRFARGSWESLLAVAIVGAFALVFLGVFMVLFPKGSGLVDLYGEVFGRNPDRSPRSRTNADSASENPDEVIATIASVSRRVTERDSDAIEWSAARQGMPIHHLQAIQTLARAGAVVSVGGRDELTLGENTLAVFTRPEQKGGSATRRASLLLVGGEIRGKVSPSGGARGEVAVLTASGSTTIHSDRGLPAQFTVQVSPDKSSTFSLMSGAAEVTASGRMLTLRPNQAVTVEASGIAGSVVSLPGVPEPIFPADHAVTPFGQVAPRVEFRWTEAKAADEYRLVVARDRNFHDVILDKQVSQPRFVHGSLDVGRYFWRVNGLHGKAVGPAGTVHELQLVRDVAPPRLDLDIPDETHDPSGFMVRGRTEPGSQLFIDSEKVAVSDSGGFQRAITLKRGVNMIVIEAVDAAGNSAYQAKYVNARF